MLKKLVHFVRGRLHRQVHQPLAEMNRLQRVLRYSYDLTRFSAEQLKQDRALDMAAALTYRTIFSLVPTLILALLVFRAFVSFDEADKFLQEKVYTYLEFDEMTLQRIDVRREEEAVEKAVEVGEHPDAIAPPQPPEETEAEAEATVQELIAGFVEQGYNVRLGSVGGVGVLLLVWAALALAVTVEDSFNRIYQAPRGRPWVQRVLLYWTVLTLGPVMLFMSLYLTGQIYSTAERLPLVGTMFAAMGSLGALFTSFLLLLLIYKLLPNAQVQMRPAIIGAAVAAVLWELGKLGFKFYVTRAVTYSVLYGSLGLLPLFLFWMYVTWLIVLFGLELTYVLQTMEGRKLAQEQRKLKHDLSELITDSRYVLPMMTAIGEGFERGKPVDEGEIAQRLRLPRAVVAKFGRRLEEAGLVHCLGGGGYTLAQPPDRIAIADLLKLARSLSHLEEPRGGATPGWGLLAELNAAETEASGNRTLADALRKSDSAR